MTTKTSHAIADYVRAINSHDDAAFIALFADRALVKDAGEEFRGIAAIKPWSAREIFEPKVTIEVLDVADRGGQTVVTAIVDGTFDKTGLPNPLVLEHHITFDRGKIIALAFRLAEKKGESPPP